MITKQELDQYEKVNKIGSGSFGDVYKVKNKLTKNFFAAKISKNQLDPESYDYKNFHREIQIISNLNHPIFLKFYGYCPVNYQEESKPVIITELVRNGSLKDILELNIEDQHKIGWNDTLKLINIYGIAVALSYLHSNHILHRDLKPENVLVDDFLCPKIADFGLSKKVHFSIKSMTEESIAEVKGSPRYISPEIWEDFNYTEAGDVYAFAMIVYQIITNIKPFQDVNNYFQIYKKVTSGERPELISSDTNSYHTLIRMCWDQNPSKRPTFNKIVEKLKTDPGFITENVNKNNFQFYIDFIDQFLNNSDNSRCITTIDEFTKYKSKIFTRKILKPQNLDTIEINEIFIQAKKFENGDIENKVPIDKEEAARLYKIAADNGHVNAMFEIGKMLLYKNGIPLNKELGIEYLQKAVDLGNTDAMYLYGLAFSQGNGVPVDHVQSNQYYEMASNNNDINAMYKFGLNLLEGVGVDIDINKAVSLFKKSADGGHPEAIYRYGCALKDGIGVKIDKQRAAEYLKMSADLGVKDAMLAYGEMLRKGDGIPMDRKEANHYIEMGSPKMPNREWYDLESLDDFTISNEFIKEPQIKKGTILSTSQPVAVKYAIKCTIDDLKKESDILLKCSHPSIQKLIGLYVSSDVNTSAIVTEYYANGSLDNYLHNLTGIEMDDQNEDEDEEEEEKENDPAFTDHYKIIYHICQAMKHLEEKNMFHGSLNPSNILIDYHRNPILSNIKMKESYSNDELMQCDLMLNYLAPEIISGNKNTIKSDVYSFGLMVEQIFTKITPFSSLRSNQEIINAIANQNNDYNISIKVPKFLIGIVRNCLDKIPENRPTFADIFNQLKKSFENNKNILYFQNIIDTQIQCPVTFYRIPKIIVKSPNSLRNQENKAQENDQDQQQFEIPDLENAASQTLISIENLDTIFSTVSYNRVIKIIMACGKYQSGKSTLLRLLTGNGAFYSGNCDKTTTMGIIIDGPYTSKYLNDRIGRKGFKISSLSDDNDSAIFFIDSQGLGDENSQNYSEIMKRYFSFFCALSDVCINITEINEPCSIFDEILNTIRRGQLMKIRFRENQNDQVNPNFEKDITKILFLVRSFEDLNTDVKTKKSFKSIQEKFQKNWDLQHQNAYKNYFPNLFKAFPLGNIKTSPFTYNCSVWNIIPDIFNLMNNSNDYTKDIIQDKIESAIIFLFSDFFEFFNTLNDKIDDQITFFTNFSFQFIDKLISKYKQNIINEQIMIESVIQFRKMITGIIIPFSIGQNTSISFQDCNQYTYDLIKDISIYCKKNIPELSSIFMFSDITDIDITSYKNILMFTLISFFPFAMPFFSIRLAKLITSNILFSRMLKHKVGSSIPFLWNKINDNQKSIIMPIITNPRKILSMVKRCEIIIVLENKQSNLMKFIIQSMTGIRCDYEQQPKDEKETILYGPFKPEYLMSRISRLYHQLQTSITRKIYILYLRDYNENDLLKIDLIQNNAMFYMSSNKSIGEYPSNKQKKFHMFYFIQRPDIKLLKKNECVVVQNQLNESVPKNDYNITFWPIIVKDCDSLNDIGPQTNKSLRWSFHQILRANTE